MEKIFRDIAQFYELQITTATRESQIPSTTLILYLSFATHELQIAHVISFEI
jgi:hypothetical protein